MPKPGLYPFLHAVLHPSDDWEFQYFVVTIARFDYVGAHVEWMNNPSLPAGLTLRPDIDLTETEIRFSTEQEALDYIRDWWRNTEDDNG